MDTSFQYLAAIDGGGSRCRFALTTPSGRLEIVRGAANVFSSRESALSVLNDGLVSLAKQAGLSISDLMHIPVYAAIAGVTDANSARSIAKALPSRITEVEDDRRAAVIGALGYEDGYLIGIGTGSFLAKQQENQIRFIGGYGPTIGDEASGNWLGMSLLRRVLLCADGIAQHSPLTLKVSNRFDDNVAEIVQQSGAWQPTDFAKFAPTVIAAAETGDHNAQELMQEGAAYISRGLATLGFDGKGPVCALGGVAPHYSPYMANNIRLALTKPKGTALDGALRLAKRLGKKKVLTAK